MNIEYNVSLFFLLMISMIEFGEYLNRLLKFVSFMITEN